MRKLVVLVGVFAALTACTSVGDVGRYKRYQVRSPAMEPTIPEGSTVTATKVKPGEYRPDAGDLVVFDPPDRPGWNPDGRPRILRVVAVPGDMIACCDPQGRITLNGTAQDEPYARVSEFDPPKAFEAITVPVDELFLLGDSRGMANDSSFNGTVPLTTVIGVIKT
ncbi:hypothetical protein GCM10009687_40540 [Asanoa iriomotensis]|uniref:Signal peptidase I n=1 Tax=Asanoa iriomotensis TaxID=234613 RepID=A0ABQ4C059_9ACTN|nr:hypothetical protein Air01nite_17850 [Asanoa iriomotensis]